MMDFDAIDGAADDLGNPLPGNNLRELSPGEISATCPGGTATFAKNDTSKMHVFNIDHSFSCGARGYNYGLV